MYESVNFSKELKQLPTAKLISFLASELKKNPKLQKEFIKKFKSDFNVSIQKNSILTYKDEFEKALKKHKKSIKPKEFKYNYVTFNTTFLNEKISYTNTLIKQKEYLEALKILIIILITICKIIAQNSYYETLNSTTAHTYEKKLKTICELICNCYTQLLEDEQHLFDRRTAFKLLIEQYELLLHSPIFNFIFIRNIAKLEWFTHILSQKDLELLNFFKESFKEKL